MDEQQVARFEARAAAIAGETLRAPASGSPCVAWRVRVIEHVAGGLELVHEVASTEAFELIGRVDDNPEARIRIEPESFELQGSPTLFREGSPGAAAVARDLGFERPSRVEEMVLREGELLDAEGVLERPTAGAGPYRGPDGPPALLGATLCLRSQRPPLSTALLPWVVGAAALALATLGAGVYGLSKLMTRPSHDSVQRSQPSNVMGPVQPAVHRAQPRDVMGPVQPARPRFP